MVFTKFTPLVLATAFLATDGSAARVDPAVHRTLRQQGTVNLIITMKKGTQETLKAVKEASFTSRGALIEGLVSRLQQHAEDTQVEVGALFAKEAAGEYTKAESFWISNQIFVEGATASLLERLTALPSVGEIREEEIYRIPEVVAVPMNSSTAVNEWGVEMIQAPAVWATGNTGKGVVVGHIDTGAQGTHEALKGNYRGAYGWFDPENRMGEPYDKSGHGSHTLGTIIGANGVGVAPGATWMSCKGCRVSCPESDLLACAQFMTCPTDTGGNNPDCSKAPHLVSNSWGGGQGTNNFKAAVDAWHAAGIIPIFSAGNSGISGCGTSNSPGDYDNVISVGATNSSEGLAPSSSKGPSVGGLMKPEISAPGVAVRSTWNNGDATYNTISGTSMAAPHVSGAIALLLAAKPGLKFDEVRDILTKSADTKSLLRSGFSCGNTTEGVFPNNVYGYGRLNVFKAINSESSATTTAAVSAQTECSKLSFTECKKETACQWSWSQSLCLNLL
ncbi:hypothetical protein Poli38472_001769 [Pythium oligandrum]|uniref:subtilisin n=1 Tax=Pythium oligandrum TaxID=41045 RepID=A0A8K1FTI0_PYTOL|nr:hypothetical protein Poli38472_001769 [Pythium oligandrum]|eukprot:TMW69613.1 hypothetical protein Poli38472_001769 [Pythium oligandrum]